MILVVGGAGYIGSHTNKRLHECGYNTVVYDNLVHGYKRAVKWGSFIEADVADEKSLRYVFSEYNIKVVMHFAAFAYVGESVKNPGKYYKNNVANTLCLLDIMKEYGCRYFIFSSTCATYGNPKIIPISEDHPQLPINPYGQSKLMVETILRDYAKSYGMSYVSLRYFNAAGADPDGEIGEEHNPETHLIPLVLDVAAGLQKEIIVFGTDYESKDGSAVRDYIHVTDIADAHIAAFQYLLGGGASDVFNLGNGEGYSVLEVIECARKITRKQIGIRVSGRREGDPAVLVGNAQKAMKILEWNPKYYELETIIDTAWKRMINRLV